MFFKIGAAPDTLNTLKEITDQLAKDESVGVAMTKLIDTITQRVSAVESNKYDKAGGTISGNVNVTGSFTTTSVSAPSFQFGSNWRAIPSGVNSSVLLFQYTPTPNDFSIDDNLKTIVLNSEDA